MSETAALEHLRRAFAAAPDLPGLHCLAGLAYLQLGDHPRALQAGTAAVSCGPEREWGHRIRAVALIHLRRPADARRAALEATRLQPEAAETHIVLSTALQDCADQRGAVTAAGCARISAPVVRPDASTARRRPPRAPPEAVALGLVLAAAPAPVVVAGARAPGARDTAPAGARGGTCTSVVLTPPPSAGLSPRRVETSGGI